MGCTAAGVAAGVGAAASAATAASSLASGSSGSGAATKAAQQQAASADVAARLQSDQINTTRATLEPYQHTGLVALGYLPSLIGTALDNSGDPTNAPLTRSNPSGMARPTWGESPITWDPTQAGLEQTPGYQFSLSQGLKGVENSYAAKGLGSSGAAMKGAADYAQGLASKTYQEQFGNFATLFGQQQQRFGNFETQFQNYLNTNTQDYAHQQQVYNMVQGLSGSGQNAAALTGTLGQQSATAQSQLITAGGAAQAAGTIGSANAFNQGLSGATGALSQGSQLYALLKSGLLGGQGDTTATTGFSGAGTTTNSGYTGNYNPSLYSGFG